MTRCQSMLNRSNKSERIIEANKQLTLQLQNEIDLLQDKLAKLDELFKTKKKHFSTVEIPFQPNKKYEFSLSLV